MQIGMVCEKYEEFDRNILHALRFKAFELPLHNVLEILYFEFFVIDEKEQRSCRRCLSIGLSLSVFVV